MELHIKRNLLINIEEGVWTFEKYLIGQFEGYEYVANQEQSSLEKRKEASYKLTNLRICNLCNFKSFFCNLKNIIMSFMILPKIKKLMSDY